MLVGGLYRGQETLKCLWESEPAIQLQVQNGGTGLQSHTSANGGLAAAIKVIQVQDGGTASCKAIQVQGGGNGSSKIMQVIAAKSYKYNLFPVGDWGTFPVDL